MVDTADHKQAEEALKRAHDDLERRVHERTSELELRTLEAESLNSAMVNLLEDLQETNRDLALAQKRLRRRIRNWKRFPIPW